MARPRKLTDEQRLENNAARQKRWRERNRVVEKLRSRSNRAKEKVEAPVERYEPIVEEEPAVARDSSYVSFAEVEGYQPSVQRIVNQIVTPKHVEQTENEKATYTALERLMARKR